MIMLATAVPTNASPTLAASVVISMIAIAVGATICANWLTSFLLVRERATLGRAILMPIIGLLAWIGYTVAAVVVALVLTAAHATGALVVLAVAAGAVGAIMLAIYLPMRIYEIGALRAIAFLIVSAILGGTFSGSAQYFILGPEAMVAIRKNRSSFERLAELSRRWKGEPAITRDTLRQRQTALAERYTQLEIRRKYLLAKDREAVAQYAKEKEAYELDLAQLKADAVKLEAEQPEAVR
jgi:hypothetical protein